MSTKHALKRYKTYMFKDQDPVVSDVLAVLGDDFAGASEKSGVSRSSFRNWKRKKTKRPQHATMAAALGAEGYVFKIVRKNT